MENGDSTFLAHSQSIESIPLNGYRYVPGRDESRPDVAMIPGTWQTDWAANPRGAIRAYIGNLGADYSPSDIVVSSLRLNNEVPVYRGIARTRPGMPGFQGPVLEMAFSRQEAVQSLGNSLDQGTYNVTVSGEFVNGSDLCAVTTVLLDDPLARLGADDSLLQPQAFELGNAHPNPFNPSTTIDFAVPQTCHVRLDVFNAVGQLVTTLVDEQVGAGRHEVVWNATNSAEKRVASGVYLYRLEAGELVQTRKMVLLK